MRRASFPAAFTLIELLVVISIVALLVSILLPALQSARGAARSTACLSNLKQVGVAEQVYENDYGHYTAVRYDDPESPVGTTARGFRNHWEMALRIGVWGDRRPTNNTTDWAYAQELMQSEPFGCPEMDFDAPATGIVLAYAHNTFNRLAQTRGLSPVTQLGEGDFGTPYLAPTLGATARDFAPADMMFVFDAATRSYGTQSGVNQWWDHWYDNANTLVSAFRHQSLTANALFLDLHAGPVSRDTPLSSGMAVLD